MTKINKLLLSALTLSLAASNIGVASAKDLDPQTKKNLETAMHGEAHAHLSYLAFAEKARENGNEELAKLFEESANVEAFEHFAREGDALGLIKDDLMNVTAAMEGEYYETTKMYKEFAEQAEKAGDTKVAKLFEQIRADESDHYAAYKAAAEKLGKQGSLKNEEHGEKEEEYEGKKD